MKKAMVIVMLMVGLAVNAQNNTGAALRTISVEPANKAALNSKKPVILNESGLIAVSKGDELTLQPNLRALPAQHRFLKGVAKSVGSFLIVNQLNKTVNNSAKGGGNSNPSIAPAAAIGLAAGLPDIIQGLKNKKSYLLYTIYNERKIPVATEKIILKNLAKSYTFTNVDADGYLKAIIIGNTKKVLPGNLNINIATKNTGGFKGKIAGEFNLEAFGDCQGGGDEGGDEGTTCKDKYDKAIERCKKIESNCNLGCDILFPILIFPIQNAFCHSGCGIGYNLCHDSAEKAYVECTKNL